MEGLSAGQVVLATFPFSDLSSKKLRPCLLLGLADFGDVILCQITSQQYDSKRAISLRPKDFSKGTIITDSFIRPDKIATLDRKTIQRVLGTLGQVKQQEVKNALRAIFELS